MAHAATLAGLAESLVTAITGRAPGDAAFRRLKDNAVRGLRDQRHARTNQYVVSGTLQGLVEKFAVLNREELATALESRLAQLPTESGWMPEILSLLLELSDQPAGKTVLSDVECANQNDGLVQDLTWADIVARDPMDDSAIWESVERGYHSSEDDEIEDDSEPTISTKATSVDDLNPADIARLHVQVSDGNVLAAVRDAYNLWDTKGEDAQSLQLSEVTITRDMLSMLHGLPTDVFQKDAVSGRISIARTVHISTLSQCGLFQILQSAADIGTTLNALRIWTEEPQDLLYIQSIQAAVQNLLTMFKCRLGDLEQSFMHLSEDTVLSIINVQSQASSAATTLLQVTGLIQGSLTAESHPFGLLDAFYEALTVLQLSGDLSVYDDMRTIFLAGFATYLRPVRSWITTGSIDTTEEETFLVEETEKECIQGELWHARFQLRDDEYIPKCMQPVANNVFGLGKSQSFLQSLEHSGLPSTPLNKSPALFSVLDNHQLQDLMPFPQLLGEAIRSWLAEITSGDTHSLPSTLLQDHGLRNFMAALPGLYFSQDGSLFQAFAESVVDHLNPRSVKTWGDQFLLTELAHDTLGDLPGVISDNIYVYVASIKAEAASSSRIRRLGNIHLRYSTSWPVQNITRSSTPKVHAQVLSFLLQLQYSTTLLSRRLVDFRTDQYLAGETLRLRQRLQCFIALFQSHVAQTANSIHRETSHKMEAAQDIDAMVTVWTEYEKQLQQNLLLSAELDTIRQAVMRILVLSEMMPMSLQNERAKSLHDQLDKELRFLIIGLRNISRVRASTLEMLADRLEWSLR